MRVPASIGRLCYVVISIGCPLWTSLSRHRATHRPRPCTKHNWSIRTITDKAAAQSQPELFGVDCRKAGGVCASRTLLFEKRNPVVVERREPCLHGERLARDLLKRLFSKERR